jgi:hypothetical protein
MVHLVPLVWLDLLVNLENLALLVKLVSLVLLVFPVNPVWQVKPVRKVLRVHLDPKANLVLLVHRVCPDSPVKEVFLDCP